MPKTTFSPSNVRNTGTTFPILKLENQGDYARIKLAEAEPTCEWVHTLRKPKLSPVTGRLIMKTIEVGKGDNKEKKEVPDLDFVGTPICFGNQDTLDDRGIDPDNCPGCKAAMEYPDFFDKPERKFAVHVFRYSTRGNSPQPVEPLSVEVRVWRMSENRFAKVVSVLEEFAPQCDGDPLRVDLTLGPCNSTKFQNYEIAGSPRCFLAQNQADWERAEAVFASNNAGDLSPYCGRKADLRYMKSDIDEIVAKWKAAQGGGEKPAEPDFAGTLADSGNALLEGATSAPAAPPSSPLSELDSTVGGSTEPETPAAEPEAPAAQAAPAEENKSSAQGPSFSFDALMGSLVPGGEKN